MNLKVIRILAYVVIVACIFVTGVSSGVIIESFGIIRQNANDIKTFTGTAEFMNAVKRPGEMSDEEYEAYLDELFSPFWESWDLLHAYYVDQPLDDDAMLEGAIRRFARRCSRTRMAAIRERIRILAAPRLLTSSIFRQV